jgi:hypothetical protein
MGQRERSMLTPLDPTRGNLRWTQPDVHQRLFELKDGDRLPARLRMVGPAGPPATGETAAGTWTFKRVGFLNPRVTARTPGSLEDAAVFSPAWGGGGSFALAGGRAARWTPGAIFGPSAQIVRPDGLILALFHTVKHGLSVKDLFRTEADVEILHTAWRDPDLPLLLVWTWYLMILAYHEETLMVAVTTGGSAS